MARKPLSLGDIIEARMAEARISEAVISAERAEAIRIETILKAHVAIGVLQRGASKVYYINWPEYREASDPADLAAVLRGEG